MPITVDRRRGLLDDISIDAAQDMDAWASWIKQHRDGIGFATTSVAYRLMQAKLVGVAAHGTQPEPEMPGPIARVDTAVGQLPKKLKRAFKVYFLWYAPTEDKARRCRCSVSEFYRRLRVARRTVADSIRTDRLPSC